MNFFDQFGIQPVLLLAQAVNFLILLFLLNKFLYQPILKVLDDRRKKIAQSLEDSEKITLELQKIESLRNQKIDQAITEAGQFLTDAKTQSGEIISLAKEQAQVEVQTLIEQAKLDIQNERLLMQQTLRSEISGLILSSLEKIITTEIPSAVRSRVTQKIAREFKN